MSKSNSQQFGPDNWLHIISNALANYVEEGGSLSISEGSGSLSVTFSGVEAGDSRLNAKFVEMMEASHA